MVEQDAEVEGSRVGEVRVVEDGRSWTATAGEVGAHAGQAAHKAGDRGEMTGRRELGDLTRVARG